MSKLGIVGRAILNDYPNGFFSLDQIVRLTEISRKYVTDVLVVFSQEGLVKKIVKQRKEHIPGHSPRFTLTYRVIDRKALTARIGPRLKESIQDGLWFIMRKKKSFILRDLIILTGAKKETVRWFLKMLHRMGITQASRTGGGPGVSWMLVKDIGPRRPYINNREGIKGER